MIEFRAFGTLDLRNGGVSALDALLSGSKRTALLAYLTLARPRGFQRRDTVLALFWPESAEHQARGSLRNMLHQLRSALGKDVLVSRGREEVGIAPGSIRCDVFEFEEAVGAGEYRKALELYRGDLMEGFHVPGGSPEFEQWLEGERRRLREAAAEAAWALAEEEAAGANLEAASYWGRRAVALLPLDEGAVRRLIALLDSLGDRAGSLQVYEAFARRLEAEWEAAPAAETQALIARVREKTAGTPLPEAERVDAAPAPDPAAALHLSRRDEPTTGARRTRFSRVHAAVLAAVVAVVAIGSVIAIAPGITEPPPVIAIGAIQGVGEPDAADLEPSIRNMLAVELARAPGVQVVGTERLYELAGGGEAGDGSMHWETAARRAGAHTLVEGMIRSEPGGRHVLKLSRHDLGNGRVEDAASVEGSDPYALAERAARLLLAEMGLQPSGPPARYGTTRSPAAYRLYEAGVGAYYAGDNDTAHRLLSSALAEDSTFAMAVYYRALTREEIDHRAYRRDLGRAARLAARVSDRERLLIQSAWAQEMDEPRQLALAETLAIRYPQVPDGHLFLGRARLWSGDVRGALPHLRRVVRMDSVGPGETLPYCRACNALQDMVSAYILADSLAAAEAVARRWVRQAPGSARAWQQLARTMEYQGRPEEAREARRRAAALRTDNPRDSVYPAVLALRGGLFEETDRLLAELRGPGASLVQQNVLWYTTLSLLYQRRYDAALRTARAYREMVLRAATPAQRRPWESVLEAQVLFEMGRPHEAAVLWRAMSEYPYEPESPARTARHRAWTLTHLAAALAAAGDTAALSGLADTIQTLGAQSAYGRDPRLHHHVRGLLHLARGDTATAMVRFRQALFSPTAGYGRVNLELGRSLLALNRPHEAAQVLGGALRGPLDAGNLYVNRTELHRMLARAHAAAGRTDSAATHREWVRRALGRSPARD